MAPTSTARALDAETAVITIDSRLAPSQRAAIRRAVDRRNERFASSDDVLVSRERGTITVTVLPSAVDAADDFGGPAFPTVADVRGAAIRAAHREARDLMRAAWHIRQADICGREPYGPATPHILNCAAVWR